MMKKVLAEGEQSPSCVNERISNINEINAINEKEMEECVLTEEKALKTLDSDFKVARRGVDDVTKKVIANLQKCLDTEDNMENMRCSSKIDENNVSLIDNSGVAVQITENLTSEFANVAAERRYCIDKSIREASKKIAIEQSEIQKCLNNKN